MTRSLVTPISVVQIGTITRRNTAIPTPATIGGPPRPRSLRIHVAGQELESGPAFHRQTVIKPVETRLCDEWFLLPTKCLFDVAHGLANYERTARQRLTHVKVALIAGRFKLEASQSRTHGWCHVV